MAGMREQTLLRGVPNISYCLLGSQVLQLDEDADEKTIKKQTRKLQFLCHPDRNRDNAELAKKAFEEIGAAKKALDDEDKVLPADHPFTLALGVDG